MDFDIFDFENIDWTACILGYNKNTKFNYSTVTIITHCGL